jgi:hypothetical protein
MELARDRVHWRVLVLAVFELSGSVTIIRGTLAYKNAKLHNETHCFKLIQSRLSESLL